MRTFVPIAIALSFFLATSPVIAKEKGKSAKAHGSERRVAPLGIPPGHLPPPGECRIWFPGRPPGQQPPPGRCARLRDEVPAGAWLLRRPADKVKEVAVNVYRADSPKLVLEVRFFDAVSGAFLRVEGGG